MTELIGSSTTRSEADDRPNAKGASDTMNLQPFRATPFRALPITVAFLLNVVVGPLAPITQLAAPVMALSGSTFNALDGNLTDDGASETDWCTPAPNLQVGFDSPSGSSDTSFASNNNKEDSNVPTLSMGTIPNNKDDLLREYVASETVGEDLFVYLALGARRLHRHEHDRL